MGKRIFQTWKSYAKELEYNLENQRQNDLLVENLMSGRAIEDELLRCHVGVFNTELFLRYIQARAEINAYMIKSIGTRSGVELPNVEPVKAEVIVEITAIRKIFDDYSKTGMTEKDFVKFRDQLWLLQRDLRET